MSNINENHDDDTMQRDQGYYWVLDWQNKWWISYWDGSIWLLCNKESGNDSDWKEIKLPMLEAPNE